MTRLFQLRTWRRLQWSLALLAALGTTALPLLGHAMMRVAAQAPAGWVEICTSQGMQWVAPDSPQAQDTSSQPAQHGHVGCYCDSLVPALGLPSVALPVAGARIIQVVSSWTPRAHAVHGAWARPYGRAPPSTLG